ncbi:MAG TPA: ATP-binding protein, partial [Candidatus Caenarcaniphilales bacterium]
QDHLIVSGMSVVIDGHNPPFGVLSVHTRKRRLFTQDNLNFLQAIGNILAETRERQRAEKKLRESEERYRKMVELSPDAIFVQSEENFVLVNRAGVNLLGATNPEQLLGKPIFDFVHPDYWSLVRSRIKQVKEEAKELPFIEEKLLRLDGQAVDVEVASLPFTYEGLSATQVVVRDISERKQAEFEREQLLMREQAARLQAEAANRMKDEFLATLSHELRTPLNALLGWSRLLRTRKFDEATTARALETIERNAKSQAQLIEDLLDVSRIIRGKLRLNIQQVELVSILESAMETVRPAADAKGIKLRLSLGLSAATLADFWPSGGSNGLQATGEAPKTTTAVEQPDDLESHRIYKYTREAGRTLNPTGVQPPKFVVSGDASRLQQIIWNLLSNAITFTAAPGKVEVRLEHQDSQIEIAVSDTGAGIHADFLPYVFDRFRQADSSLTRSHSGLGLGLAIVRHLVELHGGVVHAASEGEGQGSTFTVKLPLLRSPTPEASPAQATLLKAQQVLPRAQNPVRLDNLHVLVVDDEADVRLLLTTMLEQYGAEVKAVASAAEAIAALELLQIDVLLADLGMPGEDGYTLIHKLRKLEADPHWGNCRLGPSRKMIPAAALTAYAREEDRARALAAGFQQHISKPVEPEQLVALIAALVSKG